ncbi:hypothetical protein EUX98_g1637 [Antrodiella citrinella]|uniref:Wings apart-like protein C-terminal domain-containing protein n=1 Tax=Antrodiella citrinella TaxID=2447956 RepID=A0A4S4N0Y3_9APHY|nr:hypothetical protein EUX98_g1637 [Antrodiella citrinella]
MVRPLLAGASSNVRTYGGKSRSFLVALGTSGNPAEDDEPLEDDPEDDFTIRESYNELQPSISPGRRKGKGRQAETPVAHLPNGMMNDLKSITELRSKGESRRFLDDVGYLFEGLESTAALSVRRGSAMEIVSKLCDVEFARKAKATDFLGRTWDSLREGGGGKGDKVLDTILVFFISLVARDPRDLPEVMLKPDFNSVLFGLLASLDKINDPLWLLSCGLSDVELRHAGIAKTDKTLLHGIHTLIRKKSELFGEESAISNRLLIGYTLSALPPHLHSSSDVHILLNDFLSETEHISSRITSYASGLPLIPPLQSSSRMLAFSFLHIDHCLRLLDSYLLRQWSQSDDPSTDDIRSMENADTRQVLSRLIAICAATAMALHEDSLFALRDTVVTSHRERMAFNVQQESASDPASVYLEFCKLDAELDVVVRGHIAILFGLLMRGNTDVQRMLLEKLPGTTNKKKLAGLVDNAREFALFYVEFAKKASAATEGRNEEEGSREGPVAGDVDMRQVLRDTQGESVARDVLSFLTSLRDQTRS